MAQVSFEVAGRPYTVGCREGEEPGLRALAQRLDALAPVATRASGGLSHERTLLYIALMLADQVADLERTPASGVPPHLLDKLAERLEAVAAALEEEPASA
ncbi:cell division protein ZapA [Sphingomonas spermidinifaciens]|uniref:Cell division protein ZapA n=1 Tax=Sphingomonas spermidinifaciens TaxID=1141889 RepID=A0A2A4B7Q8_9SPHN|nr:cell division protein ZapA [Sphingomonas spermidinifaciens]PCD04117.1 cell division protein ZapA [Sphingomonas spermidinifaciens]